MEPFQLAIAMAYQTMMHLSTKQMSQALGKDEILLHGQACRTLQGYFRLNEITVEELVAAKLEDSNGDAN